MPILESILSEELNTTMRMAASCDVDPVVSHHVGATNALRYYVSSIFTLMDAKAGHLFTANVSRFSASGRDPKSRNACAVNQFASIRFRAGLVIHGC